MEPFERYSMQTLRKYDINAKLVCAVDHLYDKSTRENHITGSPGERFRTKMELGKETISLSSSSTFPLIETRLLDNLVRVVGWCDSAELTSS